MIDAVKILRGNQEQGVQILAVGRQSSDGFYVKKLTNIQSVGELLNRRHIFHPILVLFINVGVA